MLDAILNHPALKKARAAGEERVGKVVARLLANERVMGRLESLVTSAAHARETLENGLRRTLQAVNLPSTEDVEELKRKLSELEAMVDGLVDRVGQASSRPYGEKP